MAKKRQYLTILACSLATALVPTSALSQAAPRPLSEEERRHIEQLLEELKAERNDFNARIDALESEIDGSAAPNAQTPLVAPNPKPPEPTIVMKVPPISAPVKWTPDLGPGS